MGVENCLSCDTPLSPVIDMHRGSKVFNSRLNRMGRRQKEQVIREESSYQSQAQINTSSQVGLGEALKGNHPS